jgi:LacI family transcriptional regulator
MLAETEAVSTSRERRAGYCEALAAAGIPPLAELMVETTVDLAGGYGGMQKLLGLRSRPSAVFAVNNLVAVGAVKAMREQGIRVPEDMALVAFDDIEHVAALSPFLTVIPQPAETFGTVAAQLLLDRLTASAPVEPRLVILPSDLVIRQSCGAHLRTFAK